MKQEAQATFLEYLQQSFEAGTFVKLTLSKPTDKSSELKNIYLRPVHIKDQLHYSFLYRYKTKDIVKNHLPDGTLAILDELLGQDFLEASLFTTEKDLTLFFNKKRKARLQTKASSHSAPPDTSHNKKKKRFIEPAGNPYLYHLGITNQEGQILKQGQKKFRQINKYIEIIDSLLRQHPLPSSPNIVDMGSGKGYLTFALYDYLNQQLQLDTQITGIELRPPLVQATNELARRIDYQQLHFEAMDIMDYPADQIDMLIALHACDIATDIAIAKGIQSQAEIIVVAPCCHKQVRKSMNPTGIMGDMLKHGILLERQAELLTDTIRSLLMEAHGYQTKVFEFISTEHTPKNMMIVGMKGKPNMEAMETVNALKKQFGVSSHYLETLLSNVNLTKKK
jgi:SAM-dependent methyltransferase